MPIDNEGLILEQNKHLSLLLKRLTMFFAFKVLNFKIIKDLTLIFKMKFLEDRIFQNKLIQWYLCNFTLFIF